MKPFLLPCLLVLSAAALAQWTPQNSGATVRFRGVCAVNEKIAWASGANGTYARTLDGGATWRAATVPGAEKLDFRDVEAFDADKAFLLSIGEGESSRIYKTTDGGKTWALSFQNKNPEAFFDAIAFFDRRNGLAMSDPVDGRFVVMRTTDGGATWKPIPPENMPPALEGEGGFAASGTCLITQGKTNAWIATGGAARARVFRSTDGGQSWQVADTPIRTGNASSGIFSLAFRDAMNGMATGGDYRQEKVAADNLAITRDGGRTWNLVANSGLGGFRSAIAWAPGSRTNLIATGPAGTDYSTDDGRTWRPFDAAGDRAGFHALSFAGRTTGKQTVAWAAGEGGRIAKFTDTRGDK
ncbi:MAG: WD40/YVTN/BNR-like repeat-containing protein [Blastocatellia bacterium]